MVGLVVGCMSKFSRYLVLSFSLEGIPPLSFVFSSSIFLFSSGLFRFYYGLIVR